MQSLCNDLLLTICIHIHLYTCLDEEVSGYKLEWLSGDIRFEWSFCFSTGLFLFKAGTALSDIVFSSLCMCGQKKRSRTSDFVCSTPWWPMLLWSCLKTVDLYISGRTSCVLVAGSVKYPIPIPAELLPFTEETLTMCTE